MRWRCCPPSHDCMHQIPHPLAVLSLRGSINHYRMCVHLTFQQLNSLMDMDMHYRQHLDSDTCNGQESEICGLFPQYDRRLCTFTSESPFTYGSSDAVIQINGPVVLGWAASNASPDTIRALVGAVVTGFGGLGMLFTPLSFSPLLIVLSTRFYRRRLVRHPQRTCSCETDIVIHRAYVQTDAASGYHKGNSFNLFMAASLCVVSVVLFLYQRMENSKREKGGRDYRLQKGNVDQ